MGRRGSNKTQSEIIYGSVSIQVRYNSRGWNYNAPKRRIYVKVEKTCDFCGGQEYSCYSLRIVFPSGNTEKPIKYSSNPFKRTFTARCVKCGVRLGGYHHPGCDAEICPRCKGLLTKCGCLNEKECDDSN